MSLTTLYGCKNGAPPHINTSVRQVLQKLFGDRIITRNFGVSWPPRSPNLNSDGLLDLGLSEIEGVHIKFPEFVRNERCYETGSSPNSSGDDIFVIVIDNPPHATRYCLRGSAR